VAALNGALERIADAGSAIGGMVDNVRSMSRDTQRIKAHSAHLDSIDERLDLIVAQMERMVSAVEELSATVKDLQDSVEPVGRLAKRFPGRARRNAGS
jgi:methyl-accepting chemotaxis protein